jgi:RnfABCDGE-type electron transport complex B subunit
MSNVVVFTIITLCTIGSASAVILFFVARKFKVFEDPRIDQVESSLPGANCGGCGFAGCRNFAETVVKSENFELLNCPVGGNETMKNIASLLGRQAVEQEPKTAVIRCNGSPQNRPRTSVYNGARKCAIAHNLYMGEGACPHGCLGYGECVAVCTFDAIAMNPATGLPEVNDEKCTACNACVKACPRNIIELRKKNPKNRKIFISCINTEKGAISRKNCSVACIGCGKCVKICEFEAITMVNNLAYIDPVKCRLCRKCEPECPTHSILEIGFSPRKEKAVLVEEGGV